MGDEESIRCRQLDDVRPIVLGKCADDGFCHPARLGVHRSGQSTGTESIGIDIRYEQHL